MRMWWYRLRRKYPPLNRVIRLIKQVSRHFQRFLGRSAHPALLANSFPKSGTHLLTQIFESFPGARSFSSFLATTPPLFFHERSDTEIRRLIQWIVPGEIVGAHLHYTSARADLLEQRGVVPYLIYRDLRDVAASEAHYLTYMNRWHRVHRYLVRRLSDDGERLMTVIKGIPSGAVPYSYPDIASRFKPFLGWFDDPRCCTVRYEDLMSGRRDETLLRMIDHYAAQRNIEMDREELLQRIHESIQPEKSRTWSGRATGWRDRFTREHVDAMKEVAGELLIQLGYERTRDW